jgi:hypothetical protein
LRLLKIRIFLQKGLDTAGKSADNPTGFKSKRAGLKNIGERLQPKLRRAFPE